MAKTFYICFYKECFRRGLDAGRLNDYFTANGWRPETDLRRADLIVLISCGGFDFTERRCIKTVQRALSRKKAEARLIVTGCLLKINPGCLDSFEAIERIAPDQTDLLDAVIQADVPMRRIPDAHFVPDTARNLEDDSLFKKLRSRFKPNRIALKSIYHMFQRKMRNVKKPSSGSVRNVFKIKIADGCLGNCTYCALKFAGGPLRSKPPGRVLDEFRQGLASGYRRFEFVSLDLGCYGRDLGVELSALLEEVFNLEGDFKLVLNDLNIHWLIRDARLLPLLARFKNRVEHLRIPIQSGSGRILKRMKRPYRAHEIDDVLRRISRDMPGIPVHSHFMVGFPGETREDFLATARLIDEYRFSKIDVFCYQERPGVESSAFEDKLSRTLIQQRAHELAAKRKGIDITFT
jgi:tRNA A37 methylthiotransferase MiaB